MLNFIKGSIRKFVHLQFVNQTQTRPLLSGSASNRHSATAAVVRTWRVVTSREVGIGQDGVRSGGLYPLIVLASLSFTWAVALSLAGEKTQLYAQKHRHARQNRAKRTEIQAEVGGLQTQSPHRTRSPLVMIKTVFIFSLAFIFEKTPPDPKKKP